MNTFVTNGGKFHPEESHAVRSYDEESEFLAAQDKECLPEQEQVTVFTPTEIAKFKREAFSTFSNGKRNTNRQPPTFSCSTQD